MRGAEPSTWSVRDAGVEWDADDSAVEALDVLEARQARECGEPGVPRNLHSVDRADDSVVLDPWFVHDDRC